MAGVETNCYQFRSFRLDVAERQLLDGDKPVSLTPKAFDVLAHLVLHSGHLVLKDDLMRAVWPDAYVDEVSIPRTIHTIRRALGEGNNGNKFIETVPTKGYRFVAEVKRLGGDEADLLLIQPSATNSLPENADTPADRFEVVDAHVKRRNLPRFAFATVLICVLLVSVGVFFAFTSYWPVKSVVKKLAPETFSGEALQNYKQGRLLVERRHKGDYEKALEMFEKAIELDPNYANAYAGKADVKVVLFWGSSNHEDISPARTAALKAIELDETNSYGRAVLCRILTTYDWNHLEAEKECRKAVEYNPNDHEAQKEYAFLLHSLRRESDALAAIDRAIAAAPTSFNKRSRGMILYQSRRYDEAISQLEQVEKTDPLYNESSRWLIRAFEMKEDYPSALERYLRLTEASGGTAEETLVIRNAFETGGWPNVLRHIAESPSMRTLFKAGSYAKLGERELAFATLDEMFKRRAILLVTIAREPTLDPLRDDPRFDDLLKRIGLK